MTMKEVLKELKKHNINQHFELCDCGYNDLVLTSEKLEIDIMKDEVFKGKFQYYFDDRGYVDNLSFKELIFDIMELVKERNK
tara:strand:+ start:301 stop:546 length:246 start_codon:yes stop_codon:yes gene_type:complete